MQLKGKELFIFLCPNEKFKREKFQLIYARILKDESLRENMRLHAEKVIKSIL